MAIDAPLLVVKELTKVFPIYKGVINVKTVGQVNAVNQVSFTLKKGETLGLIGESGCGKSTVARLIQGILEKTSGEIIYQGEDISTRIPSSLRRKVQMVFQDPYASIDPRMNIRRIIQEPLRVHEKMSSAQRLEAIEPIIEKVGISQEALEKYPHEFSGGQRQRIGIARALALRPELLLCDEPVSSLDVSIQAQILNLFKKLQQEFMLTYLFISHDMSVIRHVSDRIAVMYLGSIVELAPKKELFDNTLHPYSLALMSAIPTPDPKNQQQRILLKGDIPSPINLPEGCPFRTRCWMAQEICREIKPPLREINPNHFVACHLVEQEDKT